MLDSIVDSKNLKEYVFWEKKKFYLLKEYIKFVQKLKNVANLRMFNWNRFMNYKLQTFFCECFLYKRFNILRKYYRIKKNQIFFLEKLSKNKLNMF